MEKSLDRKLAAIHADPSGSREFILADAKDADMAFGIGAPGLSPEAHPSELRYKTLEQYREQIRLNTRQGLVDIMLMSASTSYKLTLQERLFDGSHVTPAVRANDTTDVHIARGSTYVQNPAQPHRSMYIDEAQCGYMDCAPGDRHRGANLGLYSVTFNNDLSQDLPTLERFHQFRAEAERKGFRYFLEVFDPNIPDVIDPAVLPFYLNDMIVRMLAGVAGPGRPQFLKIVYHGPKALEELVRYDPHLVVGILGGSAGTTRDAFQMLADAQKYGARVALYGRKINNAENQLAFIQFLRLIVEGVIGPVEAVRAYHAVLQALGIPPQRPLNDDLMLTDTAMSYGGGSSVRVVKPESVPAIENGTPSTNGAAAAPSSNGVHATHSLVTTSSRLATSPGSRVTISQSHRYADALDGLPTREGGLPDFGRMSADQRLAYHRRRLGLAR